MESYGQWLSLAIVKQFVCDSLYIRRSDPAERKKLLEAGWEEILEGVFRKDIVPVDSALQSVRIN